jgi:hypothetical protein
MIGLFVATRKIGAVHVHEALLYGYVYWTKARASMCNGNGYERNRYKQRGDP